jgi:uncharacterized protein (DUF58 family)
MHPPTWKKPLSRYAARFWRTMGASVRHRQRYHLTMEGWLFLAGMTLIGFAAWHSGTNLLYLMFAMMIAFFLMHGLLVWRFLSGLDAHRIIPRNPHAGETLIVGIEVRNLKRFTTSYGIVIQDCLESGTPLGAAYLHAVEAGCSGRADYAVRFPLRGVYSLRRIDLTTRFPFGIVERSTALPRSDDLVVYPQIVDLGDLAPVPNDSIGEESANRKGSGTELYNLREYAENEHARRIHWRKSARAQKLMVMEFEREERRAATILLRNAAIADDCASPRVQGDFELAVIFAASFAKRLSDAGTDVRLLTSTGMVPPGRGQRHLWRIYSALAALRLTPEQKLRAQGETGASLVYEVRYRGAHPSEHDFADSVIDVRRRAIRDGVFVVRPAGEI